MGRRYDATQESINRASVFYVQGAADAKKEYKPYDRKTLMRLSRYLTSNLGVAKGLRDEISRYSVGTNVRPSANSGNDDWDELAEQYWQEFSMRADVTNRFSFGQLVNIWCCAEMDDGDVFVVNTEKNGWPKLQTIFGHSVETPENYQDDERVNDGVRYDDTGEPIAYNIAGEWVPANPVHHFMEPIPNRLRGVPAIAHAANNLFDLRDILSFEKQGVKLNSAIAVVLKQASGNVTGNRFAGPTTHSRVGDQELTLESILGGAHIPKIGPSDELDIHESKKTSPTFNGFLDWLIRDMAVGYGVPFEFAWNAERVGGTAQRFVMAKAQRRFTQIQNNFTPHLNNIWEYVISYAITKGELPANDNFRRVKWQFPKKATVDYGRENKAEIDLVHNKMKSLAEYYSEMDKDWRQELRQIAEEQQFLRDNNLLPVEEETDE